MTGFRRRAGPSLLALALASSACGNPAPLPPAHWIARLEARDLDRREQAVDELGKLGRADPAGVGALLLTALEERGRRTVLGVRLQPDLEGLSPAEREALSARLSAGLAERLRLAQRTVVRTSAEPGIVDVFVLPPEGVADIALAQSLILNEAARPLAMSLLPELPAPFPPTAERPVSPWSGDAASYEAWLTAERSRLSAALAAQQPYAPSTPGRRLLPRVLVAAGESADPVPVLEPSEAPMRFREDDLRLEPRDDEGWPALFVSAVPAREADFRAFLKAHAGLRLWLTVDGEALFSSPLPAAPSSPAAFRVRAASLEQGRMWVAQAVAFAALGRYPVAVKVGVLPRTPGVAPNDPLCRAIVAVGPGVEPLLDALQAKDAAWAPLVESLKDGILHGRTVQPR